MAFEVENQVKTQKWMEILENKNQKTFQEHRLAHDLGAGSPCLQCKDDCPGLDLHFWRKVCKNCKCKKESHDVKEEDDIYSKFEILFGISRCNPSQAILDLKLKFPYELDQDQPYEGKGNIPTTSSKKEYKFDWIPPNISSELAAEYMQHLPASKLPISGSDGALYRRQQLEKQVPMHDLNANMCHNLTSDEIQCLTDYLENLKQNAAGQGKIMKLPNLLGGGADHIPAAPSHPSNMPTSFSADAISSIYNTVPKPFKPFGENSDNIGQTQDSNSEFPPPPPELLEDDHETESYLKPPSAFIKQQTSRTPSPSFNNAAKPYTNQIYDHYHSPVRTSPESNRSVASNSQQNTDDEDYENKNVKDLIKKLNRGSVSKENDTNKSIAGNNGPVLNQKPYNEKINSMRIQSFNQLNDKTNPSTPMIAKNLEAKPGNHVKVTNLDEIMNNLQKTNINEVNPNNYWKNKYELDDNTGNNDGRNGIGSPNNINNELKNNALNNISNKINNLTTSGNINKPGNTGIINNIGKFDNSVKETNKICKHCKLDIQYGEMAIYTEKLTDKILWHPQCFKCNCCHELLVDLMYFYYKDNIYCLRDYATMLNIPRCFACDELIFVNEYTLTENRTYHVKHFCCYECDKELCNQQYVSMKINKSENSDLNSKEETEHPFCLDCYTKLYCKKCYTCNNVIKLQEKCIQFNHQYYWHINNTCFNCNTCHKNLNNEKFIMQYNKIFCSKPCVTNYKP